MNQKGISPVRIFLKAIVILLCFNFAFPIIDHVPSDRISLYNNLVVGRERLPFGENPDLAYNLTMNDMDAMLASHEISKAQKDESFSILITGDSSVWGTLLNNEETISTRLEQRIHSDETLDIYGRTSVYNLGYPTTSILKDLVILDECLKFQPDTIIWFITLNSVIKDAHQDAPIILNNPEKTNAVIEKYDLRVPLLAEKTYMEKTFLQQRRDIHDRIQLQLMAVMWAATNIDQYIPQDYKSAARDLEADDSYMNITNYELTEQDLELEAITAFIDQNPSINVIVVNEPILISTGMNSEVRYNFYYPRWVYDKYRSLVAAKFQEMGIKYIDLWDSIPEKLFTNSAIHYNAQGVDILIEYLYPEIEKEVLLKQ